VRNLNRTTTEALCDKIEDKMVKICEIWPNLIQS